MPSASEYAVSSTSNSTGATAIQTAFRDVTNSYLSANKENIPPGTLGCGWGGKKGALNASNLYPHAYRKKGTDVITDSSDTPLQESLAVRSGESVAPKQVRVAAALKGAAEGMLRKGSPARSRSRNAVAPVAASPLRETRSITTPNRPAEGRSLMGTDRCSEDGGLFAVSRTPGHNREDFRILSTSKGVLSPYTAQRRFGGGDATSGVENMVAATPGKPSPPTSRVAQTALLASPLYALSNTDGFTMGAEEGGAKVDGSRGLPLPSQLSLFSTPNGARRPAAATSAAAAVASGTLYPLDTPMRTEEISFYFNTFESSSESPMRGSPAVATYQGIALTPNSAYDAQAAVEEMLRGCLDSSTPGKRSDSGSSMSHEGRLRVREAAAQDPPPFPPYTALEAFLPSSAAEGATGGELGTWAPAARGDPLPDHTPEHRISLPGVFAESDEERSSSPSLGSHPVLREVPHEGVRRDPMIYFSTAAVAPADLDGASRPFPLPIGEESRTVPNAHTGRGEEVAVSTSHHSNDDPPGFNFHCRDGSGSGPDVLAMLAAAVQQQKQQRQQQHSALQLNTPAFSRCASSGMGGTESGMKTHSELDESVQPSLPPPSYEATTRYRSPSPHGSGSRAQRATSVASSTVTSQAQPPLRRSHHLPQVKAAAGCLIAVGGRRVPVDKLHLLAIGDESSEAVPSSLAGQGSMGAFSRAGPTTRRCCQSSELGTSTSARPCAEGPSVRRLPKANIVTVTRAAAAPTTTTIDEETTSARDQRADGQTLSDCPAVMPSSLWQSARYARSHISFAPSNAAEEPSAAPEIPHPRTTRHVVSAPSSRRVPPAVAAQQRCGSSATTRESPTSCICTEADVVVLLQFSKGQTMRFMANISPAKLAAAEAIMARDRLCVKKGSPGFAPSAAQATATLKGVRLGKSYLAHVYGICSPYEGVPYEDVGVCVQMVSPVSPRYAAEMDQVDGVLLREVDVISCEKDRHQHERALQQQTAAYMECERQFKFSTLPFQLESIYFTFDESLCIVFYRLVTAADGSGATSPHRCSNTSRVVRELQFHLRCRVFLKQCGRP